MTDLTPRLVSDLDTATKNAFHAALGMNKSDKVVYVAANNSSAADKASSDYLCDGVNDEATINEAIAVLTYGGKVILFGGKYIIDSIAKTGSLFPCAIQVGYSGHRRLVEIQSAVKSSFPYELCGAVLSVSSTCYNALSDSTVVAVMAGTSNITESWFSNALIVSDVIIELPDCTKPVVGISMRHYVYGSLINVIVYNLHSHQILYVDRTGKAPTPHANSVGIWGYNGANSWYYMKWEGCLTMGCGMGYKIGGDHLLLLNCASTRNIYGYTFGTDPVGTCDHANTLINCLSESDSCYPYFGQYAITSGEPLVFVNFQLEWDIDSAPDVEHTLAIEEVPGRYVGEIGFADSPRTAFWATGSGRNFKTRNFRNKLSGTSYERTNVTQPTYLQQYYDTDLGKMVFYNGTAWVNLDGTALT